MKQAKKAVWLHNLPPTPEAVKRVAQRLAEARFDLLIPCVKQVTGIADYASRVANVNEKFESWDPLMVLAEESNRLGLAVHAWCCVFPEGEHSRLLAEHPEFEAVKGPENRCNEPHRLACPNRRDVQDYEASLYQELIDGYPIAGVHLDYIRFVDGTCFCEVCRESYRAATGQELLDLKVSPWNPGTAQDLDAWIAWRCDIITGFVRRIRTACRAGDKQLSAAVYFNYPDLLLQIGQDWERWAREHLLDFVFPMNYNRSTLLAAKWTRNNLAVLAGANGACRLWEGILRPASMSTERFRRHVEEVLAAGAEGITIFEYPYLTDDDLAMLKTI